MIELTQEFGFDAAHYLGVGGAENRRIHGHSFYVDVTLRGEPNAATGVLRDLGEVDRAVKAIRADLDHQLLNDIEALVRVRRPSYGQSCVYEG
jgi:6-pyruvoyltetrahydropterin/6-carboxytetrahydropterin synthase